MVKILEYSANSLYKNHQCKKYCKSTSEFEGSEIISRTYSPAPALRFSIGGCKIKSINFYSLQFYQKFKINVCKFGRSQNRWVQLHPLHPSKASAAQWPFRWQRGSLFWAKTFNFCSCGEIFERMDNYLMYSRFSIKCTVRLIVLRTAQLVYR